MSIWDDCEKHDALPFYGFPVRPEFKFNIVTFNFPLGYNPNGDKTQEVADKLNELVGKQVLEVRETVIRVEVDPEKLANLIYKGFLDTR